MGTEGLQFMQSFCCENELTLLLVKALEIFASRESFLLLRVRCNHSMGELGGNSVNLIQWPNFILCIHL